MYIPDDDIKLEDVDIEEPEVDEEEDETDGDEEAVESDDEEAEDESNDESDPEDLAGAFARLRQVDSGDAEADVDGGDGADDGAEEGDEDVSDAEEDVASDDSGDDADGGFTGYPDAAQYQASQQAIVNQLNAQALNQARKQFQKDGIREFTMDDIYERQQDGRVIYRNPDDLSRPFANRMEAQQWIDSFNKQVQSALIKTATEIRDKNAKAAMPALRLLQFAPVYDVMDPAIREVFDDLIEDYEVKNRSGKVVGYSCDLEKMAMKAARLAKKYNNSPRKAKVNGNVKKSGARKSPAIDTRSHGTVAGSKGDREPQTMEEAMKRLREINGGK